ncbi:MAG: hypothetical protein NT154_07530 [Verrucomicrobia bacterium]|nr:hypothetical protein [Verrucomicrobiota bacterium]
MKIKRFMPPVEILAPKAQSAPGVVQSGKAKPLPIQETPPLKNSLQIKAAEYWLKLGEADQALRELEALPSRIWASGWAMKTRISAMGVLRGETKRGMTVQA